MISFDSRSHIQVTLMQEVSSHGLEWFHPCGLVGYSPASSCFHWLALSVYNFSRCTIQAVGESTIGESGGWWPSSHSSTRQYPSRDSVWGLWPHIFLLYCPSRGSPWELYRCSKLLPGHPGVSIHPLNSRWRSLNPILSTNFLYYTIFTSYKEVSKTWSFIKKRVLIDS